MAVVTNTGNLIFLGNFTQFDTNETNGDYEDASTLIGTTLSGTAANANAVATVIDNTDNGTFIAPDHDPSSDSISGGNSTDSINGSILDIAFFAHVDLVLQDNSTVSVWTLAYQTQDGDVFLGDFNNALPEGSVLRSLEVTSVAQSSGNTEASGFQPGGAYYLDDVSFVCFAAGTMIRTAFQDVPVEALQVGDLVITEDNGPQPIRWIGSKRLSAYQLFLHENLRPIRISKGALGHEVPKQDLIVSPQHRVLVRSKIAQRMFGQDEVLVSAQHLTSLDGIDVEQHSDGVTYVHFLFDRHEIVRSNGAETESLFPGPEALKSLDTKARSEVIALFPELSSVNTSPEAIRVLVNSRRGRKLASRHAKNGKPLSRRSIEARVS